MQQAAPFLIALVYCVCCVCCVLVVIVVIIVYVCICLVHMHQAAPFWGVLHAIWGYYHTFTNYHFRTKKEKHKKENNLICLETFCKRGENQGFVEKKTTIC